MTHDDLTRNTPHMHIHVYAGDSTVHKKKHASTLQAIAPEEL